MIYGVEDQGDEDFQSFFYQLSNDDEDATLEDYLMFNDNLATWADQVNGEAGEIQQPPKHWTVLMTCISNFQNQNNGSSY